MSDLAAALGLVLVIEGIMWAAFPGTALKVMEAARGMPVNTLRIAGATAVAAGFFIVWLVRS